MHIKTFASAAGLLTLFFFWHPQAADYFNVSSMLELTVNTSAGKMKGKTPEEIRDTFDIVCDYTPEEEQEVRRQHFWAFH